MCDVNVVEKRKIWMRSSSIGCARAHMCVGDRAREGELGVGSIVYIFMCAFTYYLLILVV